MTADEIRTYRKQRPALTAEVASAHMLQEIAAQLADLNAALRDGASPIAVALCSSNDTLRIAIQDAHNPIQVQVVSRG